MNNARAGWIAATALMLIVALPLTALALSPLGTLNRIAAVGSLQVADGQAYGPLQRQRFDLYRPDGAAPAAGWPMVVFFYGGAWSRGERADYRFVGEALAGRGVLTVVADYRLSPEVRYPVFLQDCAAALAHALRQAAGWGANPARVFVMGHSAGAYNAAMLALDPRWLAGQGARPAQLAGWIGLAGPYDFLPIKRPEVQRAFDFPATPLDSQPIHHAASAPPLPALLLAAANDDEVNPQRNTRGLADALQRRGVPVVTRAYDRVGHASLVGAIAWPLRALAPVLADAVDFIERTPPARGVELQAVDGS